MNTYNMPMVNQYFQSKLEISEDLSIIMNLSLKMYISLKKSTKI